METLVRAIFVITLANSLSAVLWAEGLIYGKSWLFDHTKQQKKRQGYGGLFLIFFGLF